MNTKDARIRIGVAGAGMMGRIHIRIINELDGLFKFVGVYDPNQERAKIAENYGAKAYSDYQSLLDDVEAVVIACPTSLHKKLVLEAADKDVHVLCEKPVHHTADVSNESTVGGGTKIWNNSQVRENAAIGEDCSIGKNVYIDTSVKIGDRAKIQNNVNIYHGVVVEDDVFLGPSMTFTNDLFPRASSEDWITIPTFVRKGASIGANATIICGATIGEHAMVGAGSVVTKDVKPHALVVGNPARQIGWVCKCGQRVTANGQCPKCGEAVSYVTDILV